VPNYQDSSLVETGLVIEGDEGKRYDRFRDRIMFPIINARGQVIGFGGRVLDKGEPKYLNSPETPLFEKGHELYGLFQAQKAIRARQTVVVVEGYMDVVALAQHGVDYAVATLGTATTPFHVQKLLRLSEQIVFCFDGDRAGQKAAWRALENALPQLIDGKRIGFLFLPEEHDPDTYIREFGTTAFEQELENSMPLSGYFLRELSKQVDLRTQEGRSALLQKAQPLLTAITAPTSALLLRKEIAALAGVTQSELESLYSIKAITAPVRAAPKRVNRNAPSNLRAMLRCLLAKPDLARQLDNIQLGESSEAVAINAISLWVNEQTTSVSTSALIQNFQGTSHQLLLSADQAEIMKWGETFDVDAEFEGVLNKQRDEARKQQLEALHDKISSGGIKDLTEQERSLYLKLLQRS